MGDYDAVIGGGGATTNGSGIVLGSGADMVNPLFDIAGHDASFVVKLGTPGAHAGGSAQVIAS
jgi:hypothetical protein